MAQLHHLPSDTSDLLVSPSPDSTDNKPQGVPSSDGGSFDCNICLELAQDPVVTLCGHLFCWPCLYRWLRGHSTCQECPVCKAVVEEDKVVPLYGRGNVASSDPRKKPVRGPNIPQRPSGQRPETARPPENHFSQPGFNFMTGPAGPMATARFGNFTFSAGFGLFPSLFGFQMHGVPDATGFGSGYPFGIPMGWHGSQSHAAQPTVPDQQEAKLSRLLIFLGVLVLLYIVFF